MLDVPDECILGHGARNQRLFPAVGEDDVAGVADVDGQAGRAGCQLDGAALSVQRKTALSAAPSGSRAPMTTEPSAFMNVPLRLDAEAIEVTG